MYKRVIAVLAVAAAPLVLAAGQVASAASGPSGAGLGHAPHGVGARLTVQLHASAVQPAFAVPAVAGPTVAHYSDKFSYRGTTYAYTSVGTDPRTSTAKTTVPVIFVPVKILQAGFALYRAGAVGQTTGSALFHNSPATGGTQYGDATLRNSFSKYVTARGGRWHVLLGSPVTKAPHNLTVPANQGTFVSTTGGSTVMVLNVNWYEKVLAGLAAGYPARDLVVFLTYNTVGCLNFLNLSTCVVGGFHSLKTSSTGTHTFAWASWLDNDVFGASAGNTAAMTHEIAEWLNDPFLNDRVPAWKVPGEPQYGCQNVFEVGDPLVGHVFGIRGLNYQDETDFSWFARQKPSIAFQGRYDYQGKVFRTFSPSC